LIGFDLELGEALPCELFSPQAVVATHADGEGRIDEQAQGGRGYGLDVAWLGKKTGFVIEDGIRNPTRASGDDWQAVGASFQVDLTEAFKMQAIHLGS